MSIAAISSSMNTFQPTNLQSSSPSSQSTFQELAQALESGDLMQAQTSYAELAQDVPSGTQSNNSPLSQAFGALGQDLQTGNLPAAQNDFSNVQQDLQQKASQAYHHHHHGSASQMLGSILGAAGMATGIGLPAAATSIDLTA